MARKYRKAAPVYRGKWQTVRKQILARDRHECQIRLPGCTHTATTVDHITPIAWGGEWYEPSNLRAACAPCNNALSHLARKHKPPTGTPQNPLHNPPTTPSAPPTRPW